MPVIAPIHLYDGVADPVALDKEFSFKSEANGTVVYTNPVGQTTLGDETVTMRRTSNGNGLSRFVSTLGIPIINDVGNGAFMPEVARVLRMRTEYFIPHASTAAERERLMWYATYLQSRPAGAETGVPLFEMILKDQDLY